MYVLVYTAYPSAELFVKFTRLLFFLTSVRNVFFMQKTPRFHFHRTEGFRLRLVLLRDDLFLIVSTAVFAYTVRHHQLAAFAAFYEIRSSHFPVCSSFISSSFGRFILRAD